MFKKIQITGEILEIGVQWSVAKEDIPSFERYMAQLKCYYYDYKEKIPESPLQYELLGLNLLFLLSQNRVADFHTEVELLPADQIQKNPYLKHPLSLEQCLMEGSYNKILQAKCSVPAKVYNFFIDILLQTVRNEIGVCMETAYEKISVKNATKMLNLKSEKEVMDFAKKRDWNLCPRDKYFHFLAPCEKKEEEPFPNSNMVQFAIDYAKELEMIV